MLLDQVLRPALPHGVGVRRLAHADQVGAGRHVGVHFRAVHGRRPGDVVRARLLAASVGGHAGNRRAGDEIGERGRLERLLHVVEERDARAPSRAGEEALLDAHEVAVERVEVHSERDLVVEKARHLDDGGLAGGLRVHGVDHPCGAGGGWVVEHRRAEERGHEYLVGLRGGAEPVHELPEARVQRVGLREHGIGGEHVRARRVPRGGGYSLVARDGLEESLEQLGPRAVGPARAELALVPRRAVHPRLEGVARLELDDLPVVARVVEEGVSEAARELQEPRLHVGDHVVHVSPSFTLNTQYPSVNVSSFSIDNILSPVFTMFASKVSISCWIISLRS